uniref:uncharacterized protein LOC120346509 n=1 Tax=Styela clava TaxID=7725 RepID=UPI0019395111|nr:uncharacterized protein LOC120346509 [Styela clava]
MILIVALLVLSSSCTLISTTPKLHRCRLPEASSKLDFEKLSKTSWYSGLQSNDITASMLSCIRLSNFTSTESGYRVVVKEHVSDNFLGGGHDVHMTDYKNYIASFVCPPGGISDKEHQMIWGFFPSPNPTLSQIAAYLNVLHQLGISVNFHASTCSNRDWSHDH